MSGVIRETVKVLLLNDKKELLLLCADDPNLKQADGTSKGRFWYLVGGEIECGESPEKAALREIYEETGIEQKCIDLGPLVWTAEYDLVFSGVLKHMRSKFFVAYTNSSNVSCHQMTEYEKQVIKDVAWFSCQEVKSCAETIYPLELVDYLPDIIAGKYPEKPIVLTKF